MGLLQGVPLSVLHKAFLRPLLTYASPGCFPFLSATNLTKLERLHRAASGAITGCLSSSPIPLFLTKAFLSLLRVTLTHFTLFSYERALRLPISFPISGLARLGVKPRLCRSSWSVLLRLTRSCFVLLVLGRLFLLALPVLLGICLRSRWSPPLPLHALALIPLSLARVWLSPTLSLSPLMIWCSGQRALFLFFFGKSGSGVLANCSLYGTETTLSFSAGPVCSSYSAEACGILHAHCWSRQHQQVCHISSPTI